MVNVTVIEENSRSQIFLITVMLIVYRVRRVYERYGNFKREANQSARLIDRDWILLKIAGQPRDFISIRPPYDTEI